MNPVGEQDRITQPRIEPGLERAVPPELAELPASGGPGRPAEVEDVAVPSLDDAAQHRAQRHEPVDSAHLAFWKEYLAGAPVASALPYDHRRPERPSGRGAAESFTLSEDLTVGLGELSRQAEVALPATLAAALTALLFRYTGEEDLLVGMTRPGTRRRKTGGPRRATAAITSFCESIWPVGRACWSC